MISVVRHSELSEQETSALEIALTSYYSNPPSSYYEIADQAAEKYQPQVMPFHCDLVSRVQPDARILELGCGSAHLCPHIEAAGGRYTGLDHSEKLLALNRARFPGARFFSLTAGPEETFDLVASLYTIEHVVHPAVYLQKLWDYCRPGGLIGVICPDFVDGDGLPPSFYYGSTTRRLRTKLASLALGDFLRHLVDLFCFAPSWKRRAQNAEPGAFWINRAPRIFSGAPYSVDADAVHLPRLRDLISWFTQRGAVTVVKSTSMPAVDANVMKHNCYVLVQKPS